MPTVSKNDKARFANLALANSIIGNQDDRIGEEDDDTMSSSMEPAASTVDVPLESETISRRGYDTKSSTKDIFKNLEKQVERKITNGDDVHEDHTPTRKRQRYRGSLKVYDNISDVDILQKYTGTIRRGSKMYTYEV
jgi:hypothetical protein